MIPTPDRPVTLIRGDCRAVLAKLPENSIDSGAVDPPYEIGFMGRAHDRSGVAFDIEVWRAAFRVLKPGGYLVSFGAPRTYHRMACAVEDAGFEILDSIDWLFGNGMIKSKNLGRAIDMDLCTEPGPHCEATLAKTSGAHLCPQHPAGDPYRKTGTAVAPGHETIVLARKPLVGTYAENVQAFGTGGLENDACRLPRGSLPKNILLSHSPDCVREGTRVVGSGEKKIGGPPRANDGHKLSAQNAGRDAAVMSYGAEEAPAYRCAPSCPILHLDQQGGTRTSGQMRAGTLRAPRGEQTIYGAMAGAAAKADMIADSGPVSRYFTNLDWDPVYDAPLFYCPKAPRSEKDLGCEALPLRSASATVDREAGSAGIRNARAGAGRTSGGRNFHSTVKPLALMRWLVRLVTPPGGIVIDFFTGSGTTGVAAVLEGRRFLGVELDRDNGGGSAGYLAIAGARITHALEAAHRQADADDRDLDAG